MKSTPQNLKRTGRSLERLVRLRTITLSENVRQESPVVFMVFAHQDFETDYMVFPEEREARNYAMEQEERSDAPENSWPVYALWASEWPNIIAQHLKPQPISQRRTPHHRKSKPGLIRPLVSRLIDAPSRQKPIE